MTGCGRSGLFFGERLQHPQAVALQFFVHCVGCQVEIPRPRNEAVLDPNFGKAGGIAFQPEVFIMPTRGESLERTRSGFL